MNPRNPDANGAALQTRLSCIRMSPGREYCLNVTPNGDGGLATTRDTILADLNARALHQFVFGGCRHYADVVPHEASRSAPVTTWLQGDPDRCGDLRSMQVTALSGIELQPILLDGRAIGYSYSDDHAHYCRLGGILPADLNASREEQARSVFDRMTKQLTACGMCFADTVRTWLYLDRLLDWYGLFNRVRTTFFKEQGVFDRMVPASTGIGAGNPSGSAITAGLIAMRPLSGNVSVQAVASPLQCPALDYESSFSRTVEAAFPTHRILYISGTASIDADGNSIHIGDPARQIDQTMQVVNAILRSRGMTWNNATRGVAYFKDIDHQSVFHTYCASHDLPAFPLAFSHADVCRDDLLFELELDAAIASPLGRA